MAKHYYGYDWAFGIDCCNANEPGERFGVMKILKNKQDRDDWVASDRNNHESLSNHDARHEMVRSISGNQWARLLDKYDNASGVEKFASSQELIDSMDTEE
jgi:hypothetical protein